jgi:ABC-type bacteriocin/lantibiotic exporter with double-glycine peptidase domain
MLAVDRKEIIYLYVYALFHGLIYLSIPLGIQAIISLITTNQVSTSWIVLVSLISLGVLLSGVVQMMQMAISEGIQQRIFVRAAFEFAYRIPRFRSKSLQEKYPPELMNRFFDTITVQKGLSKILIDFSTSSLQVLFGLVVLSLYHPVFIIFGLTLVLLLYVLFKALGPRGLRTSINESSHKYQVAHWLEELARAMGTFKLAGKTELPMRRTDELVTDYLGARKAHFRVLMVKYGGLILFKVLVITALLLIGGLLVINRQMNIGQFVASEIIILMVMTAVEKVMLTVDTVYDVLTSIEKLGGVTDLPIEDDHGVQFRDRNGAANMEVQLVDVACRKANMRDDGYLNLLINGGEKVFITGRSGSGRSTLLSILGALEEPESGTVLFDGASAETLNKESLRSQIGDSLEEEHIFNATLRDNIALGRPGVTEERLEEVLELMGLTGWFNTLPRGLDTMLLPMGKGLADHIIKRIILARGIADKPKLLVLEDFMVNMPARDKAELVTILTGHPWTMIAAGNDALFASMCDRVIVMDQGQVVADGPYADIIKDSKNRELLFGS